MKLLFKSLLADCRSTAPFFLVMALALPGTAAEESAAPAPEVPAVAKVPPGELPAAAPGDLIKVETFDEPSVSGTFSVNANGDILFPLIGEIPVAGVDTTGIAALIETLLEANYLRDANVSVSITKTEVSTANVLVFGGVRTPGQVSYPKEKPIDIIKAITERGGFTENALRDNIEIQRADDSGLTTLRVDLTDNEPFPLKNGDVVVVKEKVVTAIVAKPVEKPKGHIVVIGQITRPGKVPVDLDQPTDLITAIAMAGDFTRLARKSKVTVTRRVAPHGEKKAFVVDVGDIISGKADSFRVYAGDTIYVPETRF